MAKYHPLPSKERDEAEEIAIALWKCILFSASCLLVGITIIIAFAATHQLLSDEELFTEDLSFLTPPGPISKTFTIDERFRQPPSPESDEAWRGILPNGLGVVQHPALGPEVVGLAFVHQLHCLDMIRKSYFAARDCSTARNNHDNGEEVEESKTPSDDKHISHCLDYIRQSLQCHADTNPEHQLAPSSSSPAPSPLPSPSNSSPGNTTPEKTAKGAGKMMGGGGFTGYGAHQCRDFEAVFRFAEEWRVNEGKDG